LGPSANRSDSVEAREDVLPQEYAYYDARNPVLLTEIVEGLLAGQRIFLSGGAGTGKTTMVRRIANEIADRSKVVILAASTGIAACQLRGETGLHDSYHIRGPATLHSAAHLPRAEMPDAERRIAFGKRKLSKAAVIIVDEISMVDRVTFERFLTRVKPGTGILAVGDFFQLPPVPRNEEGQPDFAFDSPEFARFELIDLETVLRQAEPHFIEFLQALRHGRVDEAVLAGAEGKFNLDFPVLFGTNRQADRHNQRCIGAIEAPSVYSTCQVKKGDAEEATRWLETQTRAKAQLEVKVGMRVLCIQNHDELVNGDLGTVTDICDQLEPKSELPCWIDVEFDRPAIGKRRLFVYDFEGRVWNSRKSQEDVKFAVRQYPIVPAYALTVHKAQGLTLDVVNVDGSHVNFVPGHVYVALSRARTLDGVRLKNSRGFNAFYDPSVLLYYQRAERFPEPERRIS